MNGPISANDSMTRLIQQLLCRQNYLQALICREVVFSVFGRNVRNYALVINKYLLYRLKKQCDNHYDSLLC